ncbi:MAG: hypothetical protein K2Q01_10860, partial [Rickettsiales bacterium]|nr:hypothetical protein [Rickettsiales bacterium]
MDKPRILKEAEEPAELSWQETLRRNRAAYAASPAAFEEQLYRKKMGWRTRVFDAIANGDSLYAPASNDASLKAMQKVITELSRGWKLPSIPRLVVHKKRMGLHDTMELNAYTYVPELIEMNERSWYYFQQHMGQFKAVMAHELAHILRGDCTLEAALYEGLRPPDQTAEIGADRLGPIIYGHPGEYARETAAFVLHHQKINKLDPEESGDEELAANPLIRMLHKWAKILKDNGATNPDGTVIRAKALAIYEQTRPFTEFFARVDNAIKGRY